MRARPRSGFHVAFQSPKSLPGRIFFAVLVAGLAILAFFFFLVFIAVGAAIAMVFLIRWWWISRKLRRAAAGGPIEGEYRVVSEIETHEQITAQTPPGEIR